MEDLKKVIAEANERLEKAHREFLAELAELNATMKRRCDAIEAEIDKL